MTGKSAKICGAGGAAEEKNRKPAAPQALQQRKMKNLRRRRRRVGENSEVVALQAQQIKKTVVSVSVNRKMWRRADVGPATDPADQAVVNPFSLQTLALAILVQEGPQQEKLHHRRHDYTQKGRQQKRRRRRRRSCSKYHIFSGI